MTTIRDRLCVALDGSDRRWIVDTASALAEEVGWLKIGLEAFTAHGPDLVRQVSDLGCKVFLDLKLHDIPATVRRASANCAASGIDMLTVHAAGGAAMLEAAVEGARSGAEGAPPKVVAVTVLTSLDRRAFDDLGLAIDTEKTVVLWARLAAGCGADGSVASAREAAAIRANCGSQFLIVTPGIRPSWHSADDQRRTATPSEAVHQGADILVVGRPITQAASPARAAQRIAEEIAEAG